MRRILFFSISLALCLNLWQFGDDLFSGQFALAYPSISTHGMSRTESAVSSSPKPEQGTRLELAQAALRETGLKPDYVTLYLHTEIQTGTPWELLAAVHAVESDQSGNTNRTSTAGAIGPMQFMPATFRYYASDGNGDGIIKVTNVDDAVMTAGKYLAARGSANDRYSAALYRYNHSSAYVNRTLNLAYRLGLK